MNPFLMQAFICVLMVTAVCTGIVWGRKLRHRDATRAQLERIGWYGRTR